MHRREDRHFGVRVDDFLKGLAGEYAAAEREPMLERNRARFLSDMFYRGKHRVYLSSTGYYKEIEPNADEAEDIYHPENYFRVLTDATATELVRAQVEFEVRAVPDSERARSAARAEQAYCDYIQRTLLTESFRQEIAKRVQLQDTVCIYGWWDEAAGPTVTTPRYETVEEEYPATFQCANDECGAEGDAADLVPLSAIGAEGGPEAEMMMPEGAEEMRLCPSCGSPDVREIEGGVAPRDVPLEPDVREAGDLGLEIVPSYELTVNSAARTLRASGRTRFLNLYFLVRDRLMDRAAAEALHPEKWDKLSTGTGYGDRRERDFQQQIERTAGGTSTDRAGLHNTLGRLVHYREVWLLPETYADYEASSAHPLFEGGPEIETGQKLTDLFPDGLKLCMSGAEILAIVAEDARKHWRFVKVRYIPDSFWGGGVEDAVPLQIMLNEHNSLITTNAMTNEAPMALINSLYVTMQGTYGHPGTFMTHELLPDGVSPDSLFRTFPGRPMAAPAYAHPDTIRRQMQSVFGGGFEGAVTGEATAEQMKTATAWSIAQARATAKGQTMFALMAEGYAGVIEMGLDLFHEHADTKRLVDVMGDFGEVEILELSRRDFGRDFEVRVRPGSVVPRQDYQLRDDLMGALEAEAMYRQTYQAEPPIAVATRIAERWNVPVLASNALTAARVGQKALAALKEIAERPEEVLQQIAREQAEAVGAAESTEEEAMLGMAILALEEQMATPEGQAALILQWIQATPEAPARIRVVADKHEHLSRWYMDWLNTDEGLNASPLLTALIEGRIREHEQAAAARMAEMAAVQQGAMMQAAAPLEAEAASREIQTESARREALPEEGKRGSPRDTTRERAAAGRAGPTEMPVPR